MTGFGRASSEWEGGTCHVELRTVNHRYLDMRLRVPSELAAEEVAVKKALQSALERGRVDCTVSLEASSSANALPQLQPHVVAHYKTMFEQMGELLGERGAMPSMDAILQLPGVLDKGTVEVDEEARARALGVAVQEAVSKLVAMRRSEGEQLHAFLEQHLTGFLAALSVIECRIKELPELQMTRLRERIDALLEKIEGVSIDEQRLHQELVILADKSDVTEELNRIKSHIKQFRSFLGKGGAVGRRLDFLCQELLRETNTIGSKSSDEEIGEQLITMKAEIEKLREQVQNVE
jgi:uncharacterized protein (TIGR00255 family)